MKAKVMLQFYDWHKDDTKLPLALAADENEQNTGGAPIIGNIELAVNKLYDLVKAQKEQGKKGLFVLEIVD